ncbi:MAG: TonB-dependent receptor [Flavobacteriales bacterium]|nr:TonB-dependent receptor [Flavobacteriales bacterium]
MEFGKNRVIALLSTLVLLFSCLYMEAQRGTYSGRIADAKTGESLPGVLIRSDRGNGASSDLEGVYILNLDTGMHNLTYTLVGYKPQEKSIRIIREQRQQADLVLMEEARNELSVVVVTAGKFEQEVGDVTVSMEVIQAPLIRNKNPLTLDEILQQASGVSIVDGEPQIRSGSGYSFGAGSRVAVLMDDLPVLSGDAGRPSWGFLPVENVSQVEIVKGASSVLYGSSALSGVINFRTTYPVDTPLTKLNIFHGVYSSPQNDSAKYWSYTPMRTGMNFLHSQKFGQWDLVFGGNFFTDDGSQGPIIDSTGVFKDKYDPFDADRYDATVSGRLNMNLRYRSKKVEGLSFGLNTNWRRSNGLATLLWSNVGEGLYRAFEGSSTRTVQWLGTVDPYITYFNKKGNRHSLRTRWQSLDNDNDNNQGNFSDVLYGEYQFQQHFDSIGIKDFTLTTGLVGIQTDARGELFSGGNTNGENDASNYAAYAQLDKQFFGKLNASGGMRYEYFEINKERESKPVFRAGLSYEVSKGTYLRASYGQGFRFPSIAEKFILTSVGSLRIYPNPDLTPETSYNAEFGVKQGFAFGKVLGYLDLAFFQQEFRDYIEFTFGRWTTPSIDNLLGFGFKSVNTGKARVRGAEISVLGKGKAGPVELQFMGGYTFTQPESLDPNEAYATYFGSTIPVTYSSTSSDTTNNILKYRMQHLVRFDVQATFRKLELGVSFRSNSHMTNIDRAFQDLENDFTQIFNPQINKWRAEHTKGDFVIDTRLSYQVTTQSKVAFIVNNLLNREYSIRPLAIESTRMSMIQYSLTF